MTWNWQQSDWTSFRYDAAALRWAELRFSNNSGIIIGSTDHLAENDFNQCLLDILTSDMMASSLIEGEILDRTSVQASLARQLGFTAQRRASSPSEAGAANLMADLYKTFDKELTHASLCQWHLMLMNGRTDLEAIGRYREHKEPMQIISGPLHSPHIHFEAPPSDRIPYEMDAFIAWFNQTGPNGQTPLPAIERAGITHLWLESIHPFEDGNGRIGRTLAEKALAQTLGKPSLTCLAVTLNKHKKAYYQELSKASQSNEITEWLTWFAEMALKAQGETIDMVRFLIEKTKFLDRYEPCLNERQLKVVLRMFEEGPQGFHGGLSAGNYRSLTKAAPATVTRDLSDLVAKGVMRRTGEKRHVRYHLTLKTPCAGQDWTLKDI